MTQYVRNREELELLIITMHADGWKIRALARRFNMGRNTVRRILRKNKKQRDNGHAVLKTKKYRPGKLDPFVPQIHSILEKYPDITGVRMYERLMTEGFDGGKSILNDYLRKVRPRPKREPVIRFETEPGEQGQMDWSEHKVKFRRTGKARVISFSYILSFSRRQYIDFTPNKKFFTLIRRHQDAFEHFGGACKTCLYDNEKTVVLRWEAGQPIYNPAFTAFITHYHCRPVACRKGRPETKGKVERVFGYLNSNFFNGRTFDDFEDMRKGVRWWLSDRSDVHIHETTGRKPIELFLEQEASGLIQLPRHPYDTSEVSLRVCRIDGYIEYDTNLYSVPYEHVADILTLKATEHEIFVYDANLQLIARHGREPYGANKSVEESAHHKSCRKRYGLEPVMDAFLRLGQGAESFLEGLKNQHNSGFQARYILGLKEHYHTEDIHNALCHAVRYYAFEARAVERILMVQAERRPLEFIRREKIEQTLSALPTVKQRSLAEYGDLL